MTARGGLSLALLLAAGAQACLPDGDWKHRSGTVPEELDDGWEVAAPKSVGFEGPW